MASCSADQRMMIWDMRSKGQPGVTVHAHAADVNVLSWNRWGGRVGVGVSWRTRLGLTGVDWS